ncbi:M4 family metallopeptidase [Streptomyces albireticuli]|uniref:Peptidase M4 family protein n=1 Tax=Streptomyces albireticuli TaxID=1940 RepID=A0A2A2CXQ2_9ACTN|nr:M4 family metallopeptidase [Streptomyces albireticuli]MCD9140981.1 M4 family metallopeptidase [Streptomyces albireticuli]MCD9161057.1 M4 family metallopeptidase [Streptomyces albireticuli]MCD9190885.1 M4 family metallopeptidase [Streptomyces albireticuli]PAU44024.1 peptidase M4 family protein [Streptomyces albireticuli]
MRKPRARTGRPRTAGVQGGITGAAALISAAALVVPAAPAHAATPPPPAPGGVVPGQRTATPALVEGLREPVKATGSAADAARAHLAEKRSRYRIADPERDLRPLRTTAAGASETVRLQQRHRGVTVLGGQYVVRMEKKDGGRVVTGTSGKYFTGLSTGVEPGIGEDLAVERAVEAAEARLGTGGFGRDDGTEDEGATVVPPLTGTARGLVVLPRGAGVLTHHVTVRGADPATGAPVLREVYVDARAGYPVLQYSGIKTFGAPAARTPGTDTRAGAAAAPARAADDPAPGEPGVQGSGVRLDGKPVGLQLARDDSRGEFVLRDHSRMRDSTKNVLATWDARGKNVGDVSGTWPEDIKEFGSPTAAFGKEATEAGAVDAHWAAGKVYDYYKEAHGRNSLNGRGMTVNSLVGVTYFGMPYVNAFWDGSKMVYGSGDTEYRPLSAGLDVVGHEMTHGVVENSADLVYAGQPGALNEAIADYFGNAVKTDAFGIPMDSPDSGLLGDTLCRTKSPRECAIRDLNDGRTTSKSFLGVGFGTDNGGVHLNSTIFSGALWDIREDLGRTLADKIVYKALTEYLTPLDGFTDGRAAVLAAARALGVPAKDLATVTRSFGAHGIVPNWERAIGVDSDQLLGRLNVTETNTGSGGGWWAVSKSDETGSEPYSIWAGRVDGTGEKKLISPNDGRYHVNPATDGKTVVWAAHGSGGVDLLSRPLAGGPVKKLWHNRKAVYDVRVEGGVVAFSASIRGGVPLRVAYLRPGDEEPTWMDTGGRRNATAMPSLTGGKLAYAKRTYVRLRGYTYSVHVRDIATGSTTEMPQLGKPINVGPTALTGKHVYWLADETADQGQRAVRRANLDGSGVVDLSKEQAPDALFATDVTASEEAVTVTSQVPASPGAQPGNETLAKLWQFPADGARRARVSCNRGEQAAAAAAGGKRVIWVDGTTGHGDLVTRGRPAGNCG